MSQDPVNPDARLEDPVLEEILGALELPEVGIRKWLAHDRRFCDAHGARRVYGELLALFDQCESALERRRKGAPS